MSAKIEALEKEIRKIEKRVATLKKETPGSKRERQMQDAQLSLLGSVLNDLRTQQKKLTQREEGKSAKAGQQ